MTKPILHIPHSSTIIPNRRGYNDALIQHELELLTDWETENIFDVDQTIKVIAPYSRIFCDMERLPDENELMYQKGMGICYTHTDDGQVLRQLAPNYKQKIIQNFYIPHHDRLTKLVTESLEKTGQAFIVDCHSFSSQPLKREFNQSLDRPDICLGVDDFHTPPELTKKFQEFFVSKSLKVAINAPYSGTVVPLTYYQKESRVVSIMIEVNKKLYMDETKYTSRTSDVQKLQGILSHLIIKLSTHL